jgi:hypothetical protein
MSVLWLLPYSGFNKAILTLAVSLLRVAEIEFGFDTMKSTEPFMESVVPDNAILEALGAVIVPIPTLGGRANYGSRRLCYQQTHPRCLPTSFLQYLNSQ